MEEKSTMENITLELTISEVLLLQELTEDMDCGYTWIMEIAKSLRTKVMEAYQKPTISKEDYESRMETIRQLWKGNLVERLMLEAEERRIHFYYEQERDNEENNGAQEANKDTEDSY